MPLQTRAQTLTVFAAVSLTDAMKDFAELWVQAGHDAPRRSLASSSTLARQIEQGAPANIFASADEQWMDNPARLDLIAPDTRHDVLGNELVLVVPAKQPLSLTIGPSLNLPELLGSDARLTVGDPAHIPGDI